METLSIITGYVGLVAIAVILFCLACWGACSTLDAWRCWRWDYLRNRFIVELNEIDKWLGYYHPLCAYMARRLAEQWKNGVMVDVSTLRDNLNQMKIELANQNNKTEEE